MKIRAVLFILLSALVCSGLYAQSRDREGDGEAALRYAQWAQKAIYEERWTEALAALQRAADFADVSSDISYLLAVARSREGQSRIAVLEALDTAIVTNRWVNYSETQALLLKADQLVAMREYQGALSVLEQIEENYDASILRLFAFRGMALGNAPDYDPVQSLARFRSLLLTAMDRYPRSPLPLRIFFEYARNRKPQPSELPSGDLNLLELALRRLKLPYLLEADPDLAWMAAPFIQNTEEARRLVAAYRAQREKPSASSISAALNLGLIDDAAAVEEFFSWPALDKNLIVEVHKLLRGEEGRNLFTQKLLSFSGIITSDDDHDGFVDSISYLNSGSIEEFAYDKNQSNDLNFRLFFDGAGIPVRCEYLAAGFSSAAFINWERYPSVEKIKLGDETFEFRPAEFQYAPITLAELGGSQKYSGTAFPVLSYQFMEITRKTLVSFCANMTRSSAEFDGAKEQIFFDRGIPLRSVETLNGKQISITEFESGFPVVQRVDIDLDGRMETVRRFRRPQSPSDLDGAFDYRGFISSSESDWSGDGRHKTGETYQKDGSVVYSWDMDGSGALNHSQTENGKE